MSHARTQIRDSIATDVDGLAVTGPRVFKERSYQRVVRQGLTPCLLVYSEPGDTEQSEHDADDELLREYQVVVKVVVAEMEGIEDLLNDVAEDVEGAVDRTLGDTVIDCIPTAARLEFGESQSAAEIGTLDVVFTVTYRTTIGTAGTMV